MKLTDRSKSFFLWVLLFMLSIFPVSAKVVAELGITEFKLNNGMKVILKPTDFDDEEVFFRFTALGGYACLSHDKQISGDLAAQVVLESGIGEMTGDQLSVYLYEHSIEFNPQILPFSRVIEGSTIEREIEPFLKVVNGFLLKPNFTKEGFFEAVDQAKSSINKRPLDFDTTFEEVFFSTNTQNYCAYCSRKLNRLDIVSFDVAQNFFLDAFGDPKDFTLVIVGKFDLEKIKPLIYKYLDYKPALSRTFKKSELIHASFPKGVTSVKVPFYSKTDSLARMTFPLKVQLNEEKIRHLALACQVIEVRLRNLMRQKMDTTFGLDVAYEFPFFPFLDHPWITIQLRCDPNYVDLLKGLILSELKKLQNETISSKEFEEAKVQQKHSDEFWLHDNYFWVGVLSNYYMWNWDPKNIIKSQDDSFILPLSDVQKMIKQGFSLDNYSIISAEIKPVIAF